jgi:hypothetical protein
VIPSAGEWEVEGFVNWSCGGATQSTDYTSILSTTSTPSVSAGNCIYGQQSHYRLPNGNDYALPMVHPPYKLSLAAGATIYLHGAATYTVTPIPSGTGFIRARRSR